MWVAHGGLVRWPRGSRVADMWWSCTGHTVGTEGGHMEGFIAGGHMGHVGLRGPCARGMWAATCVTCGVLHGGPSGSL